jgi:hypothetical protein
LQFSEQFCCGLENIRHYNGILPPEHGIFTQIYPSPIETWWLMGIVTAQKGKDTPCHNSKFNRQGVQRNDDDVFPSNPFVFSELCQL